MENAQLDFETWETKKLKIFSMFSSMTDDMEIMVEERKDKNVNQNIKLGQGKSRLDQLNQKPGAGQSTYSAKEFTTHLERIDKELVKS